MGRQAKAKPPCKSVLPAQVRQVAGGNNNVSPPGQPWRPRWLPVVICVLLAAAVWTVFGQTVHHAFVNYDDQVYVYDNPTVTQGLSWSGAIWAFTHSLCNNWHPLTVLSYMLDCRLYGLHAGGYHLTNVLLHAANAIILFLLLRNLTGALWRSAFVAAVFAIHPLRVESVAWVAERKDVLSGLFFLLTLWAYSQYGKPSRNQSAHSRAWYGLALGFFALGLMSKPMLVTVPFILLLLDYWPLNRIPNGETQAVDWRLIVREKIPFLVLAVADCGATIWAQKEAIQTGASYGLSTRLANAVVSYADYLFQMVYPMKLAVLYTHPGNQLPAWKIGLALLVLIVISWVALAGRRKQLYLLMGWLWYLGMLVPVIGLMQVGAQAQADRYTYLPQIGLYLMLAWGAVDSCGSWKYRRVALGSAAVVILAGLLLLARFQTSYWKDSLTLWTHDLACTPENSLALNALGLALFNQGKLDEAVQHYQRALQFEPENVECQNNLGAALFSQGKLDEAIQHYEQALQVNPNYAQAHYNLGLVLAARGNLPGAIQHFESAIQLDPDYAEAQDDLGASLAAQGKLTEAIQHYESAIQLNPGDAKAHNNWGIALARQGNSAEAAQHFKRAIQLNPDYTRAYFNYGLVLARQGNQSEAIQNFQQALNLAATQNNTALVETIRAQLKSVQPDLMPPQK